MVNIDPEIKELQRQTPEPWQVSQEKDPESLIKLKRASWADLPVPPPTAFDHLHDIAAHSTDLGADTAAGFVVKVESAGAVIAAVLALLARDDGSRPRLIGTFSTVGSCSNSGDIPADYRGHHRSRRDPFCVGTPVSGMEIKAAFHACLQRGYSSQLCKAALWPSGHAELPRTHMQTCGMDVNRDEGISVR
ncbi:hypothetical protein LTR12_012213 [Friedmanniomyces endolithicus]|nr:hypothetical protein LTR12_012213 [Friedmanniomyces endolithicus]